MGIGGRILAPFAKRLRTSRRLGGLALRFIPDHRRRITIEPIGRFIIRNRQHRSYWLRDPLTHERFAFGVLQQVIDKDSIVWDVGSNIGMYARFETQVFGAKHVVAFEPMTANRALLMENIALGEVGDRVTVMPCALSDQDGDALLQIDDIQSGTAVLDAVAHGEASEGRAAVGLPPKTQPVATRTLDSLIEEGVLPEPTIIKIDVEGAEALVLQGAGKFLHRADPLLVVELHGIEAGRTVGQFLLDRGYRLRGKVDPRIDASQYIPVDADLLDRLQRKYDLHFIIACRDAARIPQEVPLYEARR